MINSIGIQTNNFAIQSTPAPAAAPKESEIEFSYNPQDAMVMSPVTTGVSGVTVGKNGAISTERVKLVNSDLKPNEDGSFVFDDKKDVKSFTAAHTFATVNKTLEMFENAMGQKVPWRSSREQIYVNPDKGEMLNAYYSRSDCSVNFFHSLDPVSKEMVYSGHSGEAVSHEVGHAMLDGIRPNYLNAWSPDPLGFHESFADCMGMFMATQNDETCEIAARETGGDMKKENCIARTAEELGTAINTATGKNKTGGNYIRNAINNWKWVDPKTLPENPGSDKLGTEMHNWSRVFTGAVYDTFAAIVHNKISEGMEPAAAIKAGGAEMIELYGNLMKEAPSGDFTYKQMANCMLKADAKYMGGRNQEFIRDAFTERRILFQQITLVAALPVSDHEKDIGRIRVCQNFVDQTFPVLPHDRGPPVIVKASADQHDRHSFLGKRHDLIGHDLLRDQLVFFLKDLRLLRSHGVDPLQVERSDFFCSNCFLILLPACTRAKCALPLT